MLFADDILFKVINLHFLLAAIVIFAISLAALLIGNRYGAAPDAERILPLMFSREVWQAETAHLRAVKWYQNYRILSIGLLVVTGAVVIAFF
jgi:solute:Na+ symporter, SSS family